MKAGYGSPCNAVIFESHVADVITKTKFGYKIEYSTLALSSSSQLIIFYFKRLLLCQMASIVIFLLRFKERNGGLIHLSLRLFSTTWSQRAAVGRFTTWRETGTMQYFFHDTFHTVTFEAVNEFFEKNSNFQTRTTKTRTVLPNTNNSCKQYLRNYQYSLNERKSCQR